MRISELSTSNKPYIRISKGRKKVDIPIIPKIVLLPPSRTSLKRYSYVGCESIRFNFKGKIVRLNWSFNHNKMTLYCTSDRKAYCWTNVKVITISAGRGKKEHLIISKNAFGDETERRRFKRYPIVKNITIIQGENRYPASTVDISSSGIGIVTKKHINLIPAQPIRVDFGDGHQIPIRLVRSVFRGDGSELFGCQVSQAHRPNLTRILRAENVIDSGLTHTKVEKEDAGWSETAFKRWH